MMLPHEMLPSALGLAWGMSKEERLSSLQATPVKQSPAFATVAFELHGCVHELRLRYDEAGRLNRLEVDLYVSRSFWEGYTPEEVERAGQQGMEFYRRLVTLWTRWLGAPALCGAGRAEGYPCGQKALHLSRWSNPQGYMQVEFDHPEKDFPFFVRVACYPVSQEAV